MPATRTAEAPKTAMPEIEFRGAMEIVPAEAPTQSVALAPEAATIFQIIERAARDQSVDIDKMERLILMQERVQSRSAEVEFDNAMSDAQQEMQAVRVDANNPQTKSKYASYHALDAAIRPIYAKHGFSLSFDTADGAGQDCIRIVCKVAHRGGHRERPRIDMPADGKGAKGGDVMTKTHAAGSAITYGKRYLLSMIFNVAVSHDDDGNAAGGKYPSSAGGGTEFRPDGPRRFAPNADVTAGNLRWTEQQKSILDVLITEKDVIAWNAKNSKQLQKLYNESESLWNDLANHFKAAKARTQGASKTAPNIDEKAAKIKAATDKRIELLKGGKPWTRAGLNDFWVEDGAWIDWMSDPDNGALKEYERFTTAFADAELTLKETV